MKKFPPLNCLRNHEVSVNTHWLFRANNSLDIAKKSPSYLLISQEKSVNSHRVRRANNLPKITKKSPPWCCLRNQVNIDEGFNVCTNYTAFVLHPFLQMHEFAYTVILQGIFRPLKRWNNLKFMKIFPVFSSLLQRNKNNNSMWYYRGGRGSFILSANKKTQVKIFIHFSKFHPNLSTQKINVIIKICTRKCQYDKSYHIW